MTSNGLYIFYSIYLSNFIGVVAIEYYELVGFNEKSKRQ